ncbi:hypothetical protein EVAR_91194_1 [Eumeta japonica]|uniref:Uncharacterized protein n=1 Tax=Eumeta variegata TaxID=151549 RepID=A0A4C1ZLP3_EUMVA|nr:hypothetical protein EVAR_91194_1 [Eumeta japonica]
MRQRRSNEIKDEKKDRLRKNRQRNLISISKESSSKREFRLSQRDRKLIRRRIMSDAEAKHFRFRWTGKWDNVVLKKNKWPVLRHDQLEGESPEALLIKFDDLTIGAKIKDHDDRIAISPVAITF